MHADGAIRPPYAEMARFLAAHGEAALEQKRKEAEVLFRRIGVTFAVYTEGGDPERLIPFDVIPRILSHAEWMHLCQGLEQRVRALNAFLTDIYGPQEIIKANRIPRELVLENEGYLPQMRGFTPPGGVWTVISGIDLVRTEADAFSVLEDNCRTPSGVSYMLENREAMFRLFPELCASHRIAPVSHYPEELLETLKSISPASCEGEPRVVVLTPGPYNSAYYEHSFLADEMGVELVEGADLFVQDEVVFMRTTAGPQRVDVIYRRIDDDFLDPECFRADSVVGVPGLMAAYRAGNVALANAPGTGIADDKAVYPYVPEMVRFYLKEEPILANVPTFMCERPADQDYVLANLDKLVVKLARGSGGYGMLVGPHATEEQRADFAGRIKARPGDYIAQPTLALSTVPTLGEDGIAPRHVDLRPFILFGRTIRMVAGGLTRVALRPGSLVVNSSQGGGTKDTWVLLEDPSGEPPSTPASPEAEAAPGPAQPQDAQSQQGQSQSQGSQPRGKA
ncbi:circularly permuted type 2 ATP-grasp protein [Roseomonas marmotae]|uniref:Circularly permuted type 2 ATP-grasp protein n=1 Tax=Roseomonas marmotae TaxID=2768161 RepID=A0ABS3K905_9PROT|nr:circularly permuted type 2 ATP-grasp protein [Roseomonas marmotae]MBO1073920.1 circularly permuted type 2 ATP-grasp protein [Roseomonas marmotae]QTI80959.1 circularly permuted type 2 ATP-grasp protein [Roseomonas marmotae]